MKPPKIDLNVANLKLEKLSPHQRINWLYMHFKPSSVTTTTSGGETSAIIPHLMRIVLKEMNLKETPIVFIDTGYYADNTLKMVQYLEQDGYEIQYYHPLLSPKEIEERHPNWQLSSSSNFERVKEIIKREPMDRVIRDMNTEIWVSGLMRDKSLERRNIKIIDYDQSRKIYHFHPIADWSKEVALDYLRSNGLPTNKHHFDVTKGINQLLECGLHTKQ